MKKKRRNMISAAGGSVAWELPRGIPGVMNLNGCRGSYHAALGEERTASVQNLVRPYQLAFHISRFPHRPADRDPLFWR